MSLLIKLNFSNLTPWLDINQNSDDSEETETELCDTLPNNSLLRNGLGSTGFTWPGGIIPYEVSLMKQL